jgi:serine/threonine-protein kinase
MGLDPDQVVDGKYRIVRLIGAGGMGEVYEGENLLIRRRVAIKVLIAAASANADAVRRFEREAQAAGQIGSDHILEVLDLGKLPNGNHYMVMEYLDGETLAERIVRHGHLTPEQIAPIARQFLAALASAHAAGIIHRDIKPDNVFILRSKAGRSDFVKLIDFGISKFSNLKGVDRTTRAGSLLGTPCYMSPEQARGKGETDVRSDIYSCGVILYEAVTGRLPFEGETFNDLMFKIALSDAPSPLTYIPALDPEFVWIIERAMARDPAARFQSVAEFSDKLDVWMRRNQLTRTLAQPPASDAFPPRESKPSLPTITETLDADVDAMQLQKTGIDDSWARSQASSAPRRRGALYVALGVGAAALVAVAALALSLRSGDADAKQPVTASPAPPATSTGAAPADPVVPPLAAPTSEPGAAGSGDAGTAAASAASTQTRPAGKPTGAQAGGAPKKPPTKPGGKGGSPDFGY